MAVAFGVLTSSGTLFQSSDFLTAATPSDPTSRARGAGDYNSRVESISSCPDRYCRYPHKANECTCCTFWKIFPAAVEMDRFPALRLLLLIIPHVPRVFARLVISHLTLVLVCLIFVLADPYLSARSQGTTHLTYLTLNHKRFLEVKTRLTQHRGGPMRLLRRSVDPHMHLLLQTKPNS